MEIKKSCAKKSEETSIAEAIETHGIARIDRRGRYLYVNNAYMRQHGWDDRRAAIIGEYIYDLVPEAVTKEGLEDMMTNGEISGRGGLYCRRGKSRVNLSYRWTIEKERGEAAGAVIVVSEMDDLTSMMRSLYKSISEDQSEIIVRVLATGHIVFANEAACRFFRAGRSELYGAEVGRYHYRKIREMSREEGGFRTTVYYRRNGRYVEYVSRLTRDERGEPFVYTIVGREVTEHVKSMRRLSDLLYRMLTGRERQIVERLIRGESRKEIAHELVISTATYDTLIARIKRRWGTPKIGEAVELISRYHADGFTRFA